MSKKTETKGGKRRPEIPQTGKIGKVTIAPQALAAIARQAALGVSGVAGTSHRSLRVFFRGGPVHQGVRVQVTDNKARVDLFLVAKRDANLHRLGQEVQQVVARALQELVGLEVEEVNVHIEDIEQPKIKK